MKKFFAFLTLGLVTGLGIAAWDYAGPQDDRKPPEWNHYRYTLGWLAQVMDVAALADVIEDGGEGVAGYKYGYFKARVVNPIFGCTNGQEIVIAKSDVKFSNSWPSRYDPSFEYYPTNNSRIVFAWLTTLSNKNFNGWTSKEWKLPQQPDIIVTNKFTVLYGFTRSWWYEGYQNDLPYTHFTNLVQTTRVEKNWTNYYYIVRDAVPTLASPRVWKDSFYDLAYLVRPVVTRAHYEFMVNDPLFPSECRKMQESYECFVIEDE